MNLRHVVAATFLAIAACATPSPEPSDPNASVEIPVIDNDSTAPVGELDVVDVPEVSEVEVTPVRDEVVCRRERSTGTHRAERVCRRRSQDPRSSAKAKETFESLRQIQNTPPAGRK